MGNLQVKDFPEDAHDKLRERARAQHKTVSALVTEILADEMSLLTTDEWLDEVRKLPRHPAVNIRAALDAAKDEIEGR